VTGLPGWAMVAPTVLGLMGSCAGPSAERRDGHVDAERHDARAGVFEDGMATYYAPRLVGHRTANGERYDPTALTAAHPLLPFGSRVRVTRRDGNYPPVLVRINDRCAGKKKIIDLSEAAARRLGMMRAGIVPVRLEVMPMGRTEVVSRDAN
jgi:rare lipoprotein A